MIFDFNTHFIDLARFVYPNVGVPDSGPNYPDNWHYMDSHLTKQEISTLWRMIFNSGSFWSTCPTYDHSEELLITAQAASDELYFLTARQGDHIQQQTFRALQNVATGFRVHGGVIPVEDSAQKPNIVKVLGATHFIDDKIETVESVVRECWMTAVAVWDQPWNRQHVFPAAVTRLKTVKEFDEWLSETTI